MTPIDRAEEVIFAELKKLSLGATELVIVSDRPSLPYFNRALELVSVQRALNRRRIKATIRLPDPPIEQANRQILQVLASIPPSDEPQVVIFPCLPQDKYETEQALASKAVQVELTNRNLTAHIRIEESASEAPRSQPQILIATLDDVASGRLDEHFPNH